MQKGICRAFVQDQINKSICSLTSNMYEKVLKLDSDVTNEKTLGEGLIISKAAAGIELLKFRISQGNTRGVLSVDNISGCQFYINNGFQKILRAKRMEIGKSINWKPQNVYSRIGGNFG